MCASKQYALCAAASAAKGQQEHWAPADAECLAANGSPAALSLQRPWLQLNPNSTADMMQLQICVDAGLQAELSWPLTCYRALCGWLQEGS
jgi:hypothetical protein